MAAEKPQTDTARRVWRILLGAIWRFRKRAVLAVSLVILGKLSAVAVPLILKRIVDTLGQTNAQLALPVFLLLAYALVRFLGTFLSEVRDVIFARVTQSTVSDFLLRSFGHVHSLGPRFHTERQTGALTRDIERGTGGIGFLLGVALFTIVPTMVEMGSVVAILGTSYSLWFTVIIAATFVLYGGFTIVFTDRRAIHQRNLNRLDSSANSHLVDSLLNYETVKYYGGEQVERNRFSGIMNQWVEVGVLNQRALSLLHIGQSTIIALSVASVMLLAGQGVVSGTMTVGDLVLINAYVIQICLPLNSLGFIFREAKDATINAERLFRLLEQRPEIEEVTSVPDIALAGGEVRFENVNFSYEANRPILHAVSFRIPPGGTVAVVGGSGSGKSTLGRLLFRFYEVGSGRITVDGQDIRMVSQKSLRAAIGIVPQDTVLFNDTIAYNIGYGRQGATLAEVIDAARAAQVDDMIRSQPEQYNTLVGERGVKLSGGERQRIAIARAILKNPPILVFDEATSALDTRSERAIQDELGRLAKNRTTLVIAHRLSTVVDADEILVMEHGRIIERGRHEELLAQNGMYAQMWQLQQQQRDLEQAERRLAMQPVNLVALVAGVVDGLRPSLEARRINLYTVLGSEPVRVTGDPSRLHRLVWDLGVHAIQASPAGGRIELRVERAGPNARFTLVDSSGPGRAEALDFTEVESVVQNHAGALSIEHHDTGMSVAITLPLRAVASHPADGVRLRATAPAAELLAGLRVMAVDDSEEARELIEAVLNLHGARVATYASGHKAISRLAVLPRAEWPDILLCDISLGDGEDGYAVIGRLRELEAQRQLTLAQRLPAIALTGFAASDDRMRALLAGFQLHLAKPVDPVELVATIASLAGHSSPESRLAGRGNASCGALPAPKEETPMPRQEDAPISQDDFATESTLQDPRRHPQRETEPAMPRSDAPRPSGTSDPSRPQPGEDRGPADSSGSTSVGNGAS